MKLIIILGLVGFFLALLYIRLRPLLFAARQVFGFARDVRRVTRDQGATSERAKPASDKLVRCGTCGTWVPTSRATQLRSSNFVYCSTECLENTAAGKKRKAAS